MKQQLKLQHEKKNIVINILNQVCPINGCNSPTTHSVTGPSGEGSSLLVADPYKHIQQLKNWRAKRCQVENLRCMKNTLYISILHICLSFQMFCKYNTIQYIYIYVIYIYIDLYSTQPTPSTAWKDTTHHPPIIFKQLSIGLGQSL